jgi:hypothetical protein
MEYGSFLNNYKPGYHKAELRLMRLEMTMLLEEAKHYYENLNQPKLKKLAKEASLLAQRIGTANSAYKAGLIQNMETNSRKYKKKGRFMVR